MSSIPSGFRASFWGLTNKIAFLLLATLGVLLFSVPLFSQGSNGRILGTVTDQSGGVVSGATITIIDKDRGVARTLTTDDAGEYNAPQLLPGTYTVRAEANGFKKLERENIELGVGKEVRADLTVQPGTQAQTVTVTESIPLVAYTELDSPEFFFFYAALTHLASPLVCLAIQCSKGEGLPGFYPGSLSPGFPMNSRW